MINEQDLEQLYQFNPVLRELFFEQLLFVLDPARFKAALCSLRAGKTTAIAADFVGDSLAFADSMMLYLGLTDDSVNYIFKPAIKPLLERYAPDAKIIDNEIKFSNGSMILMYGADNIKKIENYRGLKLRKAAVDECQSFRAKNLQYLVDDVLTKRLADLEGTCYLVGTPASHCAGLFYEITTGDNVPVYKWTAFDNPFMARQWQKELEATMARKKIPITHPMIRRDFFGEWVTDNEDLILPVVHTVPVFEDLSQFRTVIGLDLGFDDEMVFSILGWRLHEKKCYILETTGIFNASVSEIAKNLLHLRDKYRPERVVFPSDTGGKTLMEEFWRKYNIRGVLAEKKDKKTFLKILSDALANQDLVACDKTTQRFQQQAKKAVWNEEKTLEHPSCEVDHIDATLYGYRECLHDLEKIVEHKIITQDDVNQQIIKKMQQEIAKKLKKQNMQIRKDIFGQMKGMRNG